MSSTKLTLLATLFIAGVTLGCARRPLVVDTPQQELSELASLFPTESEIPYLRRPQEPKNVPPDRFPAYLGRRYPRYQSYNVTEIVYLSYYRISPQPIVPVVDMEVIRLATPDDAFGVFSVERPIITKDTLVHDRGYIGQSAAGFWSRDLYIRILAPTDAPSNARWLRFVAESTLRRLPSGPALPPGFDRLPLALRIPNSEVFVRRQVLRYPFLTDGYLADYDFGGRMATAFVCPCYTVEIAEKRFRAFFEAIVGQNAPVVPMTGLGDRAFLARGTRHGNILIFQRNRFLAGLLAVPPVLGDFSKQFDSLLKDSP